MDDSAILEAARRYPAEHGGVVGVGVDPDVYSGASAIVKGNVGHSFCSGGGGNAVDGAVRFAIGPLSVNDRIGGFISYDESEHTQCSLARLYQIAIAILYVDGRHLLEG